MQGLSGETWGKETTWKPRLRGEDNIKMDLREVGWGHELDWSGSESGQVASSCECVDEPSGSIKCVECLTDNLLASQEGLCSMELVARGTYLRMQWEQQYCFLFKLRYTMCIYILFMYFLLSNIVISPLLLTRNINNCLLMNCTGFVRDLPYVEYMRSAAHMHMFLIVSEKWLQGFTWNRFHNRLFCQQVHLSRIFWRPVATGAVSLRLRPTNPAT